MQIFVNNDCDILVKINKRHLKEHDMDFDHHHDEDDHDCGGHHDEPTMKDNALIRAFST
jgi:hypothetical protein